jgi:hypothetical protein
MGSDAARALQFFLVVRARIAAAENRPDRVAALVEEALAIDFEAARMYPGMLWWLTFALVELGYGDRVVLELDRERLLPWHDVALAIADGHLLEAADRLEEIGDVSSAAEVRLVALRLLSGDDRRSVVDAQLPKVLAFYRSVGATRYVREAEALLSNVA